MGRTKQKSLKLSNIPTNVDTTRPVQLAIAVHIFESRLPRKERRIRNSTMIKKNFHKFTPKCLVTGWQGRCVSLCKKIQDNIHAASFYTAARQITQGLPTHQVSLIKTTHNEPSNRFQKRRDWGNDTPTPDLVVVHDAEKSSNGHSNHYVPMCPRPHGQCLTI